MATEYILNAAKTMREAIDTMAADATDETAAKAAALYPDWDPEETYTTGQRCKYNGTLYKCLQDHTAQSDWTPDAASSLWAEILIPDPDVIPEWVQPDSTNAYANGDKVTHNGKTWVSIVDNNVWEPGVYGWDELA